MSNEEFGTETAPLKVAEFLRRLLGELGSQVGAVWFGGSGQLTPVFASGLDESGLFRAPDGRQFLTRILSEALTQGRSQSYDTEGSIEPGAFGHATIFVVPLVVPTVPHSLILVADRPNLPQQQRQGVLHHIESSCREFSRLLAAANSRNPVNDRGAIPQITGAPTRGPQQSLGPGISSAMGPSFATAAPQTGGFQTPSATRHVADPKLVLDYLLALQRSLDLTEVANVAVNDGRILFGADRVSLAMRRGNKTQIQAVSGQESVHPRGNLIRALRKLTHKVIDSGEPFRFNGSIGSIPQQLEEPLADFIQEAGTRFLLIVPLREPERLVKPEEPMGGGISKPVERAPIGALIIEQMSNSEPSPQLKATLDSVIDHVAAATFNSRAHSTIFLLPLWRSTGRFFEWLRGRRLAIAGLILALLVSAGAALALVPWEYRVEGTGRLMPVIQREIFAPWDGQVTELYVAGGDHVEKGDKLVQLNNDELKAELTKVKNELQEKQKLLHTLNAQMDEAEKTGKSEEKLRAKGKAVETQIEIDGAILQEGILRERLEKLLIVAPISGIVTTFQVEQLLESRPVKRGDLLLQVMDEKGDWQLELEIAEHRVGRILNAQQDLGPNLLIEYRLLTNPESSFHAILKSLATRTVPAEEKGSVLEARASLKKDNLPARAIGADVRARIGCGISSLGDVLFGDVVEFVQKYLWW